MLKYFHELTKKEFDELIDRGVSWQYLKENYPQPMWCQFPDAIDPLGCWSLIDKEIREKISPNYCNKCEFYSE